MRTSAWIRLVVWSVALVALVAIFVLALCYPGLFPGQFFRFVTGGSISYEDSELYTVGGGAVQAYGIKEIEINWTAGNVRIEAAEGREITMEEQGAETARDEMRYLLRDGKLITSTAAGTAMEFSLALVEALRGPQAADALRESLVYRRRGEQKE